MTTIFGDGEFNFWTAHYGSWAHDMRIVFRVRTDTTPKGRAVQKDIKNYDRILPALPYEIERWYETHPGFQEVGVVSRV